MSLTFTHGALTGLGVGALVGYLVSKNILQKKYDEEIALEISRTKSHYKLLHKVDIEPSDVLEDQTLIDASKALASYSGVKTELENVPVKNNIFASDDHWDYNKELKNRGSEPYVIHVDEFGEDDYSTASFTYFVVDETLCDDERNEPFEGDIDAIFGSENIKQFGHGSKDPNVVYIRNPKTVEDYEILRFNGSYLESIGLGDG